MQPESVDEDHGKGDGHGWAFLVGVLTRHADTKPGTPVLSHRGGTPVVQGQTPNGPRTPASIRRDSGSVHALSRVKTSGAPGDVVLGDHRAGDGHPPLDAFAPCSG